MLSIQAVRGLHRLRAPGIVTCIISLRLLIGLLTINDAFSLSVFSAPETAIQHLGLITCCNTEIWPTLHVI